VCKLVHLTCSWNLQLLSIPAQTTEKRIRIERNARCTEHTHNGVFINKQWVSVLEVTANFLQITPYIDIHHKIQE
jgi:hypothetical protein